MTFSSTSHSASHHPVDEMISNGEGTTGTTDTNGIENHSPSALASLEEFLAESYDFIVVGGGTAGLVIAVRLSEDPNVKVGVIEAGKNRLNDVLVDVPAYFGQMLGNPEYDWMLYTEPQEANKGKVHQLVRGKALGGSSAINYMMYARGSNSDYDDWAALAEDPGWSSAELKKYMRKHQTLESIAETVADRSTMHIVNDNHGTSGPVRTSFNEWKLPIEDDVIKACEEATGITKKVVDPWSGEHVGFFSTLGLVARSGPNKGKRSYAARGYLEPNLGRPNLKVLCEAAATGVALDGSVAKGVNFTHGGTSHRINVKREVIVCTGVVHSPQILELSGIGDPSVLEAAGVECKVELVGVGNNFQDHSLSATLHQLKPGNKSLDGLRDPNILAEAQQALMEGRPGPLTSTSSVQGFFPYKLFATKQELENAVQSVKNTPGLSSFQQKQMEQVIAHLEDPTAANLQFALVLATFNPDAVDDHSKLWAPPDPSVPDGMAMGVCLQYPASRGSIHITSSDPSKPPAIDPAYLKHPADVAVLAAGMKMLQKVSTSRHLKDKLAERKVPAPEVDLQDTQQASDAVRDWVVGEYHPAGSCAMGDVVDSKLRVKGVTGLRVADASIFPNHVSGNIVSSVYAVAERAADLIKADCK